MEPILKMAEVIETTTVATSNKTQLVRQATIGTSAHFEGIILSKTGITFQTNASINGRSLAPTAVVLDKNAVTQPQ